MTYKRSAAITGWILAEMLVLAGWMAIAFACWMAINYLPVWLIYIVCYLYGGYHAYKYGFMKGWRAGSDYTNLKRWGDN